MPPLRRYAVVGAGAAGLVAAHELRRSGAEVVVLERSGSVGGRTRTVRFADDHLLDSGAAWLASFYRHALRYAAGLPLLERDVAGTPRLRVMDRLGTPVLPAPFRPTALARTRLLSWQEKARLVAWVIGSAARGTHVGPRRGAVQRHDSTDAAAYARGHLGAGPLAYVLRPAFETMVFAPVDELSAAFVGNWAGAALVAGYRVPAAGMDQPWRRLAATMNVITGCEVVSIELLRQHPHPDARVRVRWRSDDAAAASDDFDGVVVALPAPIAATMVRQGVPGRPSWLDEVRYAEHVFGYGARPASGTGPSQTTDIHPAGPGAHRIGSVQLISGGDGRVPPGWQAAVVSATGPWSAELLRREAASGADDDALFRTLWRDGAVLESALFPVAECRVRHVVRWRHAVPVFGPGHLTRLAQWRPTAPVALAGDWAWYPCIEGAVMSGQRAAAALLTARGAV